LAIGGKMLSKTHDQLQRREKVSTLSQKAE